MIVCTECGTRNAPGTQFCGECGSFLEWEGTDQQAAAPAPVTTARGGGTTTASPSTASPTTATPSTSSPTTSSPTTSSPTTGPPATVSPSTSSPSTSSPPVEGKADFEPVPKPVEEAKPQLFQPTEGRRKYIRTDDAPDTLAPGEIACRNCQTGNVATRKFCRACGTSLAAPVEVVKLPWWRRLWNWLTRRNRYEAGTRRKIRHQSRWVRPVAGVGIVALLLGAAYLLPTRTYIDRAITGIRDRTAKHVPVTPTALRASSAGRGMAPQQVSDGVSNKFWSPSRGPAGQWIEADFDRPVRLLELVVTPGVSTDKEKFLQQGRPRDVTVTLTGEDGKVTDKAIVVQDQPGAQTFAMKVSDVVKARLTIASGYEMRAPTRCAIGELEFFIRG